MKIDNTNIEIHNEDCMDIMSRYEDNYFDLAVVDPPYGIGVNVSMGRRSGDKKSDYLKFHGGDKSPPNDEYFHEVMRVSVNQVIWGANHFIDKIPLCSPCWLMWDKGHSEDVTFAQFELAWTSFKSTCKKYDKPPNEHNRIHPTQKPKALYKWIYEKYAKEGQKIIDTHLGSGTNAIAAHYSKMGEFVGCELDKHYYDLCVDYVTKGTRQMELF